MMIMDLSNSKNVKSKSICLCRKLQPMGMLLPVSIHKKQPITSSKFMLLILACFGDDHWYLYRINVGLKCFEFV